MGLMLDILTIVLPVFAVIALGTLLKRWKLIDPGFVQQTNRLVYYVALPLLLFFKIGTADFGRNFNAPLVAGSALAVAGIFFLSYGWARLRGYPPACRGSFSQGSFRGNLAYVGLALCLNAYGEEGLTRAGILMGFLVPVLNLFAIIALLLPQKGGAERPEAGFWLRQLAYNPLILASFAGLFWSFFQLPMPAILSRSLQIATAMTLPLALIALGGSFSLARLKGDLKMALLASALKLAGLPLLALALLLAFGVGGTDLGIGLLMAGTPAATATYIMAHQMKGDAELAGSIVMISTLLSVVTYSAGLLLLRMAGL